MKPEEIVIKTEIKCKCCHKVLKNNALYGDFDEGFDCEDCGISYDAYGVEL